MAVNEATTPTATGNPADAAVRPLTRAEAQARAELLRVHDYRVELDVTDPARFQSTTAVRFACTRPGAATFIELKGATLRRATLNGAELDPATHTGNRLPLPDLRAENELRVEAIATYSHGGDGLHQFVDPVDGEVYLYCEAPLDNAQRVFACFDQPDLKATISLTVTAPPQWTVRGNAPRTGPAHPDGRWTFATTPPLATYLFCVVAGPYHLVESEHDGIPLGLLCRKTLADRLDPDAGELFAATAAAFDSYHERFGVRYPFGKYDQVFVPQFTGGAQENPALVTFREEFLFDGAASDSERHLRLVVLAHEMAHMWFGDLVTLRWWDDIWLNEAFAEYLGWRTTADTGLYPHAFAGFAAGRKRWGYRADQRPSTHPVAPSDVTDVRVAQLNFDGISYAKGAAVLRQLFALLGDDAFFAGLRAFFLEHQFANASLADLLAALSRASGVDLDEWSRRWLCAAGVNTIEPVITPSGRLELRQHGAPLRPHRMAVAAYTADGLLARAELTLTGASAAVDGFDGLAGRDDVLVLVNDGDLTYAKVRLLDPAPLAAVLPTLPGPQARALVWGAATDAVRDGLAAPADFLALVEAALPSETETEVFEEVVSFTLHSLARRGLVPFEPLADACRRALAAAAAGSGYQVATARALVSCAPAADADLLAGWLAGRAVPAGLVVEADLRWRLLERLAALTASPSVDPAPVIAAIEAEVRRDPSERGLEHAAACRAALADVTAKAQAWDAIVNTGGSRIARASAAAFWQPGQEAITDPYVERFFTDMPTMLRRLPQHAALKVLQGAFPTYHRDALTPADELLARPDLDPSLRREIGDAADELRRWTSRP
jgi:aminopeptidase N